MLSHTSVSRFLTIQLIELIFSDYKHEPVGSLTLGAIHFLGVLFMFECSQQFSVKLFHVKTDLELIRLLLALWT
jgi:hypothetical protein